jgi:16S rRNA G1207 methylase RsmC
MNLKAKNILIINDNFGALCCSIECDSMTVYSDSFISSKAIRINSRDKLIPINNLSELKGTYDYVVIQIPKTLSFFEDILCHLTKHIDFETKIVCASMIKHLAKSSFDLLEKYIGKTTTSLAKKKARLIFASLEKEEVESIYPKKISIDGFSNSFINHSNVFSREKLDIGTRFFLEHIPIGDFGSILDLGCANGVVGIKAKLNNPNSKIIFNDESMMAILSAKQNYNNYFDDIASYSWSNCYEGEMSASVDLVLCNPPFHQIHTIGDFIAIQMFKNAKKTLRAGGKMIVIGNSHLAYQVKLKKIFGNSTVIALNKKFMIISVTN